MNKKGGFKYLVLFSILFILGWFTNSAYSFYSTFDKERPFSPYPNELNSPSDWIKQDQIKIYKNFVVIKIKNATWARFANTNSMDPILDETSHSIEIKPTYATNLKVGDIISYKAGFVKGVIIHRIIQIGQDEQGWYAITKGDNNKHPDPLKVRFSQIKGVLVGVIY